MKTILTIFGVSGDLAGRKLLPALTRLDSLGRLPEDFYVVGVARRELDEAELLAKAGASVLADRFEVVQLDSSTTEGLVRLKTRLDEIAAGGDVTKLYYASVPPTVATSVIAAMGKAGLADEAAGPVRLMLEKPFGYDLDSAVALNDQLMDVFDEGQVYRIDHYLSKEMARNLRPLRAGNPLIERLWNGRDIERIELTAFESLTIEGRGDFYEQTGALRDIVQSHLMNLAASVMMEEPGEADAASLHAARLEVLHNVAIPTRTHVPEMSRRGQYVGYRESTGNESSFIETYAELDLRVGGERWNGTQLVLRTGKAMAAKLTEIRITFRSDVAAGPGNQLIFTMDPVEDIKLTLEAKVPGLTSDTEEIALDRAYEAPEVAGSKPDGYGRVLLEAMTGDRSHFLSGAEVLASWRIVDPVLVTWQATGDGLISYEPGAENV